MYTSKLASEVQPNDVIHWLILDYIVIKVEDVDERLCRWTLKDAPGFSKEYASITVPKDEMVEVRV